MDAQILRHHRQCAYWGIAVRLPIRLLKVVSHCLSISKPVSPMYLILSGTLQMALLAARQEIPYGILMLRPVRISRGLFSPTAPAAELPATGLTASRSMV